MLKKFSGDIFPGKPAACMVVCLLAAAAGYAQTVRVAQKTVQKTISAAGIQKIVIGSEKADITVHAWPRQEIQVSVDLSARHPDKSVSQKDLEKMELVLNRERKTFHLRDFILLKGKDGKPESNLRARYTVYAPPGMSFDIRNAFGVVSVKGFSGKVNLKANFCDISMSRLSGGVVLNTAFGKLEAEALSGDLGVESTHTEIVLKGLGGDVTLNTSYGSLRVEPGTSLTALNLRLKKTAVDLVCPEWRKYSYAIRASYTRLKLPDGFRVLSGKEESKEMAYTGGGNAPVTVQAEFGDLSIR